MKVDNDIITPIKGSWCKTIKISGDHFEETIELMNYDDKNPSGIWLHKDEVESLLFKPMKKALDSANIKIEYLKDIIERMEQENR
jgi:hypothetical protein